MTSEIFLFAVILILVVIAAIILRIVDNKTNVDNDTMAMFRDVVFKLFLYAEKENWIGEEKMAFCVKRIKELMPWLPMSDETIRSVAQDLYQEYKEFVEDELNVG